MNNFKQYYFTEKDEMPKYEIFIDLDGVLCNFDKAWLNLGISKLTLDDYKEKFSANKAWKQIHAAGVDFWANMEWMPDGKKLWNNVKKHEPTILTSPSKKEVSKEGKTKWVERELGKDVPLIFSRDKFEHASENRILIDDSEKKINNWIEHNGIGILFTNISDVVRQLKELGL